MGEDWRRKLLVVRSRLAEPISSSHFSFHFHSDTRQPSSLTTTHTHNSLDGINDTMDTIARLYCPITLNCIESIIDRQKESRHCARQTRYNNNGWRKRRLSVSTLREQPHRRKSIEPFYLGISFSFSFATVFYSTARLFRFFFVFYYYYPER